MTDALSDIFAAAQATSIEWNGEKVHSILEFAAPKALIIEFLRSVQSPVQGLAVKAYGGNLRVNETRGQEMVIWTDHAPNDVRLDFESWQGRAGKVKIWNIWRGKVGGVDVTQAWLGNSAMSVRRNDGELQLRCSDGEGEVDFRDLEARVTLL